MARNEDTEHTGSAGSLFDAALTDAVLLERVVDRYEAALGGAAEAQAFVVRRGLGSAEVLARFRVGFADRSLTDDWPDNNRLAGRALRDRFKALGVLRANGREHLRGCVTFPICDEAGRVVEVYGRRVNRAARGSQPHLFVGSPPVGVFNVEALAAVDEVIVCGSVIDALTFWAHGHRHVVAVFGPDRFGDEHVEVFRRHDIARVVVAFGHDRDGDAGADALARRLATEGIVCLRAQLPGGADVNALACRSEFPASVLADAVRNATWMAGVDKSTSSARRVEPANEADSTNADSAVASPLPARPGPGGVVEGDEMRLRLGNRLWRVRGLAKNTSFDLLKVTVRVGLDGCGAGAGLHVDTFDLYNARARATFVRDAAHELALEEATVRGDLGVVLDETELAVTAAIRAAQEPEDRTVALEPHETAEALELLGDPKLVERIADDFERAGMVGERTNCLVGYLATVSRLLDRPLAVVVQSTSAAGKSALMDAVLDFVPGEDLVRFSAVTGQALFYMGRDDLTHRVLAIAEEQGAERAAYALKLLQSEGELTIASTGKDAASGDLAAKPYRVEGPTAIFLTTTAIDIDEELLNRCVVLTVDEDRDQTRAIHDRQRRGQTLDGLLSSTERDTVRKLHQNAQRLLKPIAVVNPYAERLSFSHDRTRTRRDHVKYLNLISTVALLHQHQRPRHTVYHAGVEVTYIEATVADIALANELAHEILGRSLDELPPQTRRLLGLIDAMVTALCAAGALGREQARFTRRELREHTGWGDSVLKRHLARLVELELVIAHRSPKGQTLVYELAWAGEGADGARFVVGLADPATLVEGQKTHGYDADRTHPNGDRSQPRRTPDTGRSQGGAAGSVEPKPQATGNTSSSKRANGAKRASGADAAEVSYMPADPGGDEARRAR